MIRITRAPEPAVLAKHKARWTMDLLAATTPEEKKRALSMYKKAAIKAVLDSMFYSKCAYCESRLGVTDQGHIEHYRPSSIYPELAFDWDNLLLSCSECNGKQFKSDQFPRDDEGGPLINPCSDDPNEHLQFEFIEEAKLAVIKSITRRGLVTKDVLGLNRRPKLQQDRSNWISIISLLKQRAPDDPEAHAIYQEALLDSAEYAAFSRSL
jgi:uncharacterized protein (TIGR02646 family)